MANDPTTYSGLVTCLADWINRDDLTTTQIPQAIALAERRFQREIRIPEREDTTTLSATGEALALPTDFWGATDIFLNTDPRTVLEPMPLHDLRNKYGSQTTGKPQNYAIRGQNIIFGPAPDTSYSVMMAYIKTIPALSTSQTTNELITDHPDLYINASLAELYALTADEQRSNFYAAKRDELIEDVNRSTRLRKQGGPPVRIRSPYVV